MQRSGLLYFALGVTTVISLGAVTNQLVPLASGTGVGISDTGITFPDGTVQTTAALRDPRRAFYLTPTDATTGFNGAQAAGAGVCEAGFHFASLFEILDVTSLRYDTTRGQTADDSGQGPPSSFGGWVRTGFQATGDDENQNALGDAGYVNCDAWTTADSAKDGTIAGLNPCWQEQADCGSFFEYGAAQWWLLEEGNCNNRSRVWCVEDYPGAGG